MVHIHSVFCSPHLAWYKQVNVGPCSKHGGSQPWALQIEARQKWDAWNALGDMSKEDAEKAYVDELVKISKGKKHEFKPQ